MSAWVTLNLEGTISVGSIDGIGPFSRKRSEAYEYYCSSIGRPT